MDTFIYFAYGSNMLTERLQNRCPSATPIGVALAKGHDICFGKLSKDESGKATLITGSESDKVYGILFKIENHELLGLDRAEGVGCGYEQKDKFPVIFNNKEIYTVTYIAVKREQNLSPYDWYFALVLAGALQHKLPDDYIKKLFENTEFECDTDKKRLERVKALCILEQAGYKTIYQELTEKNEYEQNK